MQKAKTICKIFYQALRYLADIVEDLGGQERRRVTTSNFDVLTECASQS